MYKRLHDTISESRKLSKLSDFAFRLWTIGLTKADWFGRLPADPEKVKIMLFPGRSAVSEHEIMSALDELADVHSGRSWGLVHLYQTTDGYQNLVYHNHEGHNPSGGWKSKPCKGSPPPVGLCRCIQYTADEQKFKKSLKTANPFGGSEFRFFKGLFPTDECSFSSPLLSSPLNKEGSNDCGENVETLWKDEETRPASLPALKELFLNPDDQGKVQELMAYFEHVQRYTSDRIDETVRFLFNIHQSMEADGKIPAGRIFRYAIDETIKHKGKTIDYTAKVLQSATMKWRDGVAFKS